MYKAGSVGLRKTKNRLQKDWNRMFTRWKTMNSAAIVINYRANALIANNYRVRSAFRLLLVYKYFFSINIVYESFFIYGEQ
jgi:hypothetical protein